MNNGMQRTLSSQAQAWIEQNQEQITKALGKYFSVDSTQKFHSNDPTQEEVEAVIQELRDRGQVIENPPMVGQANVLPFQAGRKPAAPQPENLPLPGQKTCRAENLPTESPARQLAEHLPLAGYLLIVAAASALLISASLQVFGHTWQGWLKASLLEAGILLFAVSRANSSGEWLIKRFSAAFLISLSLFVLHTGVETDRHEQLASATSEDVSLQILQDRRERLLSAHDRLPETHVTRRTEILASIESLDSQITQQLEAAKSSASAQIVNLSSWSESLMRVALLLISIVFSHALVCEFRERVTAKEGIQTG
ncbi:MAG: hypothetical protein ACOH5I_26635 [Oligoflexus sp.]